MRLSSQDDLKDNFLILNKNNCVSTINQLLCTLRFYATGCFKITAGDLCGFSSSTVNRIVHKVSCVIASLRKQYIYFPENAEEIRRIQLDSYRRAKYPRVIGAIDCTHVKLWQSPGIMSIIIFYYTLFPLLVPVDIYIYYNQDLGLKAFEKCKNLNYYFQQLF